MSEHERERAEEKRVVAEDERVQAEVDRVDAEAGAGGHALEQGRVQAEEGRVSAEDVRDEGESRRQVAEGVSVDAEIGRVQAERERQMQRGKMYRRVAMLVALPIALIVLVPLAAGIYIVNDRAVSVERKARIIAVAAAQVNQERAYEAQLAGCVRGNVIRRQVNANGEVIHDFAFSAANASMERSRQFRSDGNTAQADINLKAAKKYTQYAKALKKIPLVDCLSVIPKP